MKILFQGDSITDYHRDYGDTHDMGEGYARYASAMIVDTFPDDDFEFINLGISGNRTSHLVDRLQSDFIDVQPDVVSILIGVNDVWHHFSNGIETTDEQFEANLRTVLGAIKEKTSAKIMMIQPFLFEEVATGITELLEELSRKQAIFKRLADEYADLYLPLDEILHEEMTEPQSYYSDDGVHPNSEGSCFIGEIYLRAITPLIESLTKDDSAE